MLITVKNMCFPCNSQIDICIHLKEEVVKVPVKVRRLIKSTDSYEGIGVELMNPPSNYLEFVDRLKYA
jgi:hypothetical protein